MRNVPAAETVPITPTGGGFFEDASSDGSVVFYLSGQGLYAYDVESGIPTLLTVTQHAGETPEVKGTVIGASEDGSYVYLVAGGVLSENGNTLGEKAVAGANNLYVLHSELAGGVTIWKTTSLRATGSEIVPSTPVASSVRPLCTRSTACLTAAISSGGVLDVAASASAGKGFSRGGGDAPASAGRSGNVDGVKAGARVERFRPGRAFRGGVSRRFCGFVRFMRGLGMLRLGLL